MSSEQANEVRQEAEFVERFAKGYRAKFASLIEQLNHPSQDGTARLTDLQCLRLCVEAVDLMLDNQRRLADVVARISDSEMKSAA